MPLYNNGKLKLVNGGIDLDTDTIKAALLTASYTPNIDTQVFLSDVNTNEVAGTGYTAGGATLTNAALTVDTTNDRVYFDADDTTWPNSTITGARYVLLYKSTGSAATSPLIGYIDLLASKSTVADTFYLQWALPAVGAILYLT